MRVNLPVDIDPKELWENIFGACPETWEWWARFSGDWEYHEDQSTPQTFLLGICDPDDDDLTERVEKVATLQDLIDALPKAIETTCYTLEDFLHDADACSADCLLQVVVLGEVIYG
jgi:hypothetical protein